MTRKAAIQDQGHMIGRRAPCGQRPLTKAEELSAMVKQFRTCSQGSMPRHDWHAPKSGAQLIAGLALAAVGFAVMAFLVVTTAVQLVAHAFGH